MEPLGRKQVGAQTTATRYLTSDDTKKPDGGSNGVGCIGCHALSRDGTKVVAEVQGQNDGRLLMWDVANTTPIVVVMNNKGYTTERFLLDGTFNDIHNWAYHKIPEVLGAGRGYEARTEGELDDALAAALADRSGFSLIHVKLDRGDLSPMLQRLTAMLAERVR